MVPGFVRLGFLAVLFQVLVVVGFYGYLRVCNGRPRSDVRTRVKRLVAGGVALVALGQFAGLGAVGSLRTAPLLSLREAALVREVGLVVTLAGYVAVGAGFVLHSGSVA